MSSFQQQLQQLQQDPLFQPAVTALVALLVLIALFRVLGSKSKKEATGTVFEGGVRRSTR